MRIKAYENISMRTALPSSFILIRLLNAIIAPKSVLLKCETAWEAFKARNNKKAKKQRETKKQRTFNIKEAGSLESVFSLLHLE